MASRARDLVHHHRDLGTSSPHHPARQEARRSHRGPQQHPPNRADSFRVREHLRQFPDATTIEKVKAATGTQLELGSSSSNQIFRQLLANPAIVKSEKPFWCKTAWSKKKPDDIFTPGKALQPGEVGFAYIAGLSSANDPLTPIVVTPLIPGTTRFDPKAYGEKAIILRLDNSATPMQIRKDTGEVWWNGMSLFDPRQPFWNGKAPDIKWPE
jgi:hypothetical protein